jgi:hypothetical protein
VKKQKPPKTPAQRRAAALRLKRQAEERGRERERARQVKP